MTAVTVEGRAVPDAVGRSRARAGPVALVLAAGAAAVVVAGEHVRRLEAVAARPLVAVLLGRAERPPGSAVVNYPAHGSSGALAGLRITPSCSSASLVAVFAALGALAVLTRRFAGGRVVGAVLVASGFLFVVNLLRVVAVAGATHRWGADGFELAHRVVGSGLVVVAATVALAAAHRFLTGGGSGVPQGRRRARVGRSGGRRSREARAQA
jgi:exosortase/archaeosortase family protein